MSKQEKNPGNGESCSTDQVREKDGVLPTDQNRRKNDPRLFPPMQKTHDGEKKFPQKSAKPRH